MSRVCKFQRLKFNERAKVNKKEMLALSAFFFFLAVTRLRLLHTAAHSLTRRAVHLTRASPLWICHDDMRRWWMNSVSFCQTCLYRFWQVNGCSRGSRHGALSRTTTAPIILETCVYSTKIQWTRKREQKKRKISKELFFFSSRLYEATRQSSKNFYFFFLPLCDIVYWNILFHVNTLTQRQRCIYAWFL